MPEFEQTPRRVGPSRGADRVLSERESSPLPLRLAVGPTGLGIELTRTMQFGQVSLEEASLALPAVTFPVDLSKGVKQFLNRPTIAANLCIALPLATMLPRLDGLEDVFGAGELDVQLRSVQEGSPDADRAVAVSLRGTASALSFELVLTGGEVPRFVVDRPRAVGLGVPATHAALRVVDGIRRGIAGSLGAEVVTREGRSLLLDGLLRHVALNVAVEFGLRLPAIEGLKLAQVDADMGTLRLEYSAAALSPAVGRRGVRLLGQADHLRSGDEFVAQANWEEARSAYMRALEAAPFDVATLLVLAEIDAVLGHHESARSFLAEVPPSHGHELLVAAVAAPVFERAGRLDLAGESYELLAERDSEPALSGFALLRTLDWCPAEERLARLDSALRRAPTLRALSLARFLENLKRGRLEAAKVDAERYVALAKESSRGAAHAEVGAAFAGFGHLGPATSSLLVAHRGNPRSIPIRDQLAQVLDRQGETARAVALWQGILREVEENPELVERHLDEIRFRLAEIHAEDELSRSLALAQLRRIESRGILGARARRLEGAIAGMQGDRAGRMRAHGRLLEAIEFGWVSLGEASGVLLEAVRDESQAGEFAFVARALTLVRNSTDEIDSKSFEDFHPRP